MTALVILIPLSLGLGLIGLGACLWALRHGQFDDPEGNAWRVIEPENPRETKGNDHGRLASHPEDRHPAAGL